MAECSKIPVLAVVGPTASGKTSLAVAMCERFDGEVVSADSMQIYKGLDIASAKPTVEEMRGIPHHMISCVERNVKYSVAGYCEQAAKIISDIRSRGKLPVLCGGTGLYISSLLGNIGFSGEGANAEFREKMRARAEKEGNEVLLKELERIDPQAAKKLHPNNLGRIIRALELYELSGLTPSEHNRISRQSEPKYDSTVIYICFRDRQVLYDRINSRVDSMLKNGLVEEARGTVDSPDSTASKAIGPKELKPYFEGLISLEEAVENLKRDTRRYAKRQMTWFNRYEEYKRLYADEFESKEEFENAAAKIWMKRRTY